MYSLVACVWLEWFSFCGNSQRIVRVVRHCNGDLCEFTSCLHLGSFLAPLCENIRILLCRLIRCMGTMLLFFSVFDETFFSLLCANLFCFRKQGSFLYTVLPCSFCYVEMTLNNSFRKTTEQRYSLPQQSFGHVTLGLASQDWLVCLQCWRFHGFCYRWNLLYLTLE